MNGLNDLKKNKMNKEELKKAIENKIEKLEQQCVKWCINDTKMLEIAISNLYIALSNIK